MTKVALSTRPAAKAGAFQFVAYLNNRADSLEQAVEIAKGCPCLEYGQTVEVREIVLDEKRSGRVWNFSVPIF
jgi:hypothetical protein